MPLSFTVNIGQADSRVNFIAQGPGYKLLLSSAEAMLTLNGLQRIRSSRDTSSTDAIPLKINLKGANRQALVEGLEELSGKSNYFIGRDPKKWRTNVPTYARVRYTDVYPGVDLIYYGNQQQLEYDLVVAPHTDPE
jgi:hypothetical protein